MRGQEPRDEWFDFGLNPQNVVLNFLALHDGAFLLSYNYCTLI